jgi:poly(3-hydroxybutyrate) depolymerase
LLYEMHRHLRGQFPYAAFFWPALATASAGEMASSMAAHFLGFDADGDDRAAQEPEGATPGKIVLELQTVRLRDYTVAESAVPTLLCTPLALHGAAIADLATTHSLVAALRGAGIERLFMADWRSASADMRFLGIDDYLADLNVLVDQLGGLVDLVGLCQGGWLSLVFAARFPAKVRKLVMAGAPVDIAAGQSELSAVAAATPLAMFQSLVSLGDGRVIGRNVAKLWGNDTVDADDMRQSLQTLQPAGSAELTQLEAIFRKWNSWTIDVPGNYYLEVIEKLYKRNELATGGFVALGQRIDLSRLRIPMYLLAGSDDEVVAPEQLLAVERLVGTSPAGLRHDVAPCNHLGLFMGKQTLEEYWPRIVRWMKEPVPEGDLRPERYQHSSCAAE